MKIFHCTNHGSHGLDTASSPQEVIRFCLLLNHIAFQGFLEKAKQRHFSKESLDG